MNRYPDKQSGAAEKSCSEWLELRLRRDLAGKFHLLRPMLETVCGSVWQTRDLVLDRLVTVEAEGASDTCEGASGTQFAKRSQWLAGVRHSMIPRVYGIETARRSVLFSENLPGESLKHSTTCHGPFTVKEIRRFGQQLCSFVEYLGSSSGPWKVPFHHSLVYWDRQQHRAWMAGLSLNYTNKVLHVRGESFPEDVYAVGALMFYAATCRKPIRAAATLRDGESLPHFASVCELRQEIPRSLGDLIDRCLLPEPEQRPKTVLEFLRESDCR